MALPEVDTNAVLGNLVGIVANHFLDRAPMPDDEARPGTYKAFHVVRYDIEGNNPHTVGTAYYVQMAVAMCEEYQNDANTLLAGRYEYRVEVQHLPERRKAIADRRGVYPES